MNRASERRRAIRVQVNIPAAVEVLGVKPARFDPDYESLAIPNELAGQQFVATIIDLSVNGARVNASIVPALMSRLSLAFDVPGHGPTLAACLVMWRRLAPLRVGPDSDSPPEEAGDGLGSGFGVLFEALDLSAREAIGKLAHKTSDAPSGGPRSTP